jgi:hypothetical protein
MDQPITEQERKEYAAFLDVLRDSGKPICTARFHT